MKVKEGEVLPPIAGWSITSAHSPMAQGSAHSPVTLPSVTVWADQQHLPRELRKAADAIERQNRHERTFRWGT